MYSHLFTLKFFVGTIDNDIRISDYTTGRPCVEYCSSQPTSNDVGDRFRMKIFYAGKALNWDVIFNSLSPEEPPDFNLNDDNFMRTISVDCLEKFVPSLNNWKSDDASSLKNVITELVSCYRKYHVSFSLLQYGI